MGFVLALAASTFVCWYLVRALRNRKRAKAAAAYDTTTAIEMWIAEALEVELAQGALGLRNSTEDERRKLSQSLHGNPDADVVTRVETAVRTVEIEYVRYAHETDTEIVLHVRYEDGKSGAATKRMSLAEIPETIRDEFERKRTSHVFRTWTFPWARARAF